MLLGYASSSEAQSFTGCKFNHTIVQELVWRLLQQVASKWTSSAYIAQH